MCVIQNVLWLDIGILVLCQLIFWLFCFFYSVEVLLFFFIFILSFLILVLYILQKNVKQWVLVFCKSIVYCNLMCLVFICYVCMIGFFIFYWRKDYNCLQRLRFQNILVKNLFGKLGILLLFYFLVYLIWKFLCICIFF